MSNHHSKKDVERRRRAFLEHKWKKFGLDRQHLDW